MKRSDLVANAEYYYRKYGYGTVYRVKLLDTQAYNMKESNSYYGGGKPVLAKTKTSKGILVKYLDTETGGEHHYNKKPVVLNIDYLQGPWAEYEEKHAEELAKKAAAKLVAEQAQLEKKRLIRVTERRNEQLTAAGLNVSVEIQNYGGLPGYGMPADQPPTWVVYLHGEDALALVVESLLPDA